MNLYLFSAGSAQYYVVAPDIKAAVDTYRSFYKTVERSIRVVETNVLVYSSEQ